MFLSKRLIFSSVSTDQVLTEFNDSMKESGFGPVLDKFRGDKGRFISFRKVSENPDVFRKNLEQLVVHIMEEFVSRQAGGQKGVFKENVKEAFVSLLNDMTVRSILGQETLGVLGLIVTSLAVKSGKGSEDAMARMLKRLHEVIPSAIGKLPASFYSRLLTELYDPSTAKKMETDWFAILPKGYHEEIRATTQKNWNKKLKPS